MVKHINRFSFIISMSESREQIEIGLLETTTVFVRMNLTIRNRRTLPGLHEEFRLEYGVFLEIKLC